MRRSFRRTESSQSQALKITEQPFLCSEAEPPDRHEIFNGHHKFLPNTIHLDIISVILVNINNEKELVKINCVINDKMQVSPKEVVKNLRTSGFLTERSMIYYQGSDNIKVFLGYDTKINDYWIELEKDKILTLCHKPFRSPSLLKKLLEEQQVQEISEKDDVKKKTKRIKERTISDVVQKVALWRKLYNGFYDGNGQLIQLPLDTAAKKIGISKKTLDDYLFQIRSGKKYGFDFNQNRNEKIGCLRTFVKNQKKSSKKQSFDENEMYSNLKEEEKSQEENFCSESD